jgi:hypothetical protein
MLWFSQSCRTFLRIAILAVILLCSGIASIMAMEDPLLMANPEEFALFEKQGRWGYKDGQGRVVIDAKFHAAQDFLRGGIAAVVDEQGWAYIDQRGCVLIRPFIFDNGPDYFQEGLARFTVDRKFGFFDDHGQVVISPRFDFAFPFHEGLAAACMGCRIQRQGEHPVVKGGDWGYVNHKGAWAIPPEFQFAGPFANGEAQVTRQGKCAYIDQKGTIFKTCSAKENRNLLNHDSRKKP